MQHLKGNTRRVITFGLGIALGLSFLSGTASATTGNSTSSERGNQGQTSSTKDCDGTHHSNTGHGANTSGAYDNTCDGSPSQNGAGGGNAGGKPCAGCVGNADDKNPPGQAPDGSDHNNGYECDQKGRSVNEGNNGVGFGNPAHTGCTSTTGTTGTDGSTPPAKECPAGAAAMTAHSYVVDGKSVNDLTGKVHAGDHVVANFTISADCPTVDISLVSYSAPSAHYSRDTAAKQVLSDSATGTFGPGAYSLDVDIPGCFFQVDFVRGAVIPQQGPASSHNFYGDQGRLIDADNGGTTSCAVAGSTNPPVTAGGITPGAPGNNGNHGDTIVPTVTPVVTLATPGAVLAGSIVPADLVPAAVAGVELEAPIVPAAKVALRATEVKGIQIERGAPSAGLARTGLTVLPLAGLGMTLCLIGMAMTAGRRRQDGQGFIAIADRLAGN